MLALRWTVLLLLLGGVCWCQATVRPVWNMGHMVNSVAQTAEFLDLGANALEADVAFHKEGRAEYTYHGWPCDCFRNCRRWEYIGVYLDHVQRLSTPGSGYYRRDFVLFSLDLKLKGLGVAQKHSAMRDLGEKLLDHLWKNGKADSKLRVLFHLPSAEDISYASSLLTVFKTRGFPQLQSRLGFDSYSGDSLSSLASRWRTSVPELSNLWQGDGITNCLPRSSSRLREIIGARDRPDSFVKKVYWWTVDKWGSIQSVLRMGVDGVMTNHPDRVVGVLREPEFRGYLRLAGLSDDPFQKVLARTDYETDVPDYVDNLDFDNETLDSYL